MGLPGIYKVLKIKLKLCDTSNYALYYVRINQLGSDRKQDTKIVLEGARVVARSTDSHEQNKTQTNVFKQCMFSYMSVEFFFFLY